MIKHLALSLVLIPALICGSTPSATEESATKQLRAAARERIARLAQQASAAEQAPIANNNATALVVAQAAHQQTNVIVPADENNTVASTEVTNNQVAITIPSVQGFLNNNAIMNYGFQWLNYVELCNIISTCQDFQRGALNAQMPTGEAWIQWVKRLLKDNKKITPKALFAEIAAACTRCSNPITALNDIAASCPIPINFQLNDVTAYLIHKVSYHPANQLSELTPYAIALATKGLLASRAPRPGLDYYEHFALFHRDTQLIKDLLMEHWALDKKNETSFLNMYLQFVHAIHGRQQVIINCLDKQLIKENCPEELELVSAGQELLGAMKDTNCQLYEGLSFKFNTLPVSADLFAAEDQLITLYTQYMQQMSNEIALIYNKDALASYDLAEKNVIDFIRDRINKLDAQQEIAAGAEREMICKRITVLQEQVKKLQYQRWLRLNPELYKQMESNNNTGNQ